MSMLVVAAQVLYSIAAQRNAIPLPIVPSREGLLLPPARYCITNANYHIQAKDADTADRTSNTLNGTQTQPMDLMHL